MKNELETRVRWA